MHGLCGEFCTIQSPKTFKQSRHALCNDDRNVSLKIAHTSETILELFDPEKPRHEKPFKNIQHSARSYNIT